MANENEIARIADAVVAIRPDWPVSKVADYLETHHASRSFESLAAAAAFVAAQPMTRDLTWLEHDGYWWIHNPAVPERDAETQKVTRVRDEKWWANYNLAAQLRAESFTPADSRRVTDKS